LPQTAVVPVSSMTQRRGLLNICWLIAPWYWKSTWPCGVSRSFALTRYAGVDWVPSSSAFPTVLTLQQLKLCIGAAGAICSV
jgi:hypothetical protein